MRIARAKGASKPQRVVFVTSSEFKKQENEALTKHCELDGVPIKKLFTFEFRANRIQEELEADLQKIVQAEVKRAYETVKIPCIVEHAGLVFEDYADASYPGGLTKPMWNTLGSKFVQETNSAGRGAIARAVVAYCDGKEVRTFQGETKGVIARRPVGRREFYWDTVFIPNDPDTGKPGRKTYAQICEDPGLGLAYKMCRLSQSTKAMLEFLRFLKSHPHPELWAN